MDEEFEVLLLDEKIVESELKTSLKILESSIPYKVQKARISVPTELLQSLNENDRMETVWEREMKRLRATRKIYEQDSILKHINNSYEELDKQLDDLERERLEIMTESVYSELFLLTLHQELIILKDFESMENLLTMKVNEKLIERDNTSQNIQMMTAKIDQKNKGIANLQIKIDNLQTGFMEMISNNEFVDFLKKIFKKKFKPPKNEDYGAYILH